MKLLIVEDEEKLAQHMKNGFESDGYVAEYCLDGEQALEYIETNHEFLDAIILDISLPKRGGLEVCRSLRQENISVPVLFLTAKGNVEDKIIGLNAGADDYLVKPFSFDELLARVRALLRRPKTVLPIEVKVGDLVLNLVDHSVVSAGKKLSLTRKEFGVLQYFMMRPNQVVERGQLTENLWDQNFDSFSNIIDVHIKNLRKKLKDAGQDNVLETVRGVGFRLRK